MARTCKAFAAAIVLVLGFTSVVNAQNPPSEWNQVQSQTRPGDVVHVTDTSGRAFRWKLTNLPVDEVIRQAGLSQKTVASVAVERADSPWNGALIGFAVAGAPWLIVCATNDWCYYNEYGGENLLRVTALTTTAIGAGLGALIDLSVRQRLTVFRRMHARLTASPTITPARAAIRFSVAF
jgi:hypothetical protein